MLLRKGIHFATNSNDRDHHFWCSDFSDFNAPTFPIDRGLVGLLQSRIRRHLTNIYHILGQSKYLKPSNYLILFRCRLLVNPKDILSRCPRKSTLYRDWRDRDLPYCPPSCGSHPGFHSAMTSPVGGESRSNMGSDESISRVLRVYFPWTKTAGDFQHFYWKLPPASRLALTIPNKNYHKINHD
jgi:hypothetical protein